VSRDPGADVRHWLLSASTATLSTIAAEREVAGWPFGSLAPYALCADGTPVVLLSEIAQHTKNVRRDPRLSLFVSDPRPAGDPQASWRVTVLGRARPLERDDPQIEEIHARYRERVPNAPSYLGTHDFTYFALEPTRVRAIGGFGAIRWLEPQAMLRDPQGGGLREAAAGILSHMNADHEDALRAIVAAATGTAPARAQMCAIDRAASRALREAPDGLRYIPFGREIEAGEAREVFVSLRVQPGRCQPHEAPRATSDPPAAPAGRPRRRPSRSRALSCSSGSQDGTSAPRRWLAGDVQPHAAGRLRREGRRQSRGCTRNAALPVRVTSTAAGRRSRSRSWRAGSRRPTCWRRSSWISPTRRSP
jgi:putative heme iron utilization protein